MNHHSDQFIQKQKRAKVKNAIREKKFSGILLTGVLLFSFLQTGCAQNRAGLRQEQVNETQKKFEWWPTDAQPGPVQDEQKGGYWWWPKTPGQARPWGNRGYVYVYKLIYDYKAEELPPAKPAELRPSLLIKKIIKNVKVYFDYDRFDLRNDAIAALKKAVGTLNRNPETEILVTGNADRRGSESYNEKLARKRAEAVKEFLIQEGIPEDRIKIVSRGKLDAVAPVTDLVGMQKERNAQFMIADVEEVMIPSPGPEVANAKPIDGGKYLKEEEQELEGEVKVATREYTIEKNDTLGKIAKQEMGAAYRWKYLYEFNNDRIKNPNKLQAGTVILIPVEVKVLVTSGGEGPVPQPPTAAPQEQPVAGATREYTVQAGDTLGGISLKELGTSKRWREILDLNKDTLKSPEKLRVGQKIFLPAQ